MSRRAPECLIFVTGMPPEMSLRPGGTVWFLEARDVGQDSGKVPKEGPKMLVLRGPLGLLVDVPFFTQTVLSSSCSSPV